MDYKSEEYSSLRAELLEEQSAEASLLLTMYTIFVALITFAIDKQNFNLFLIAIYVNFLFKLQLCWKSTGRMRIVAYLIVNYEMKSESTHWELDLEGIENPSSKYLKKWLKIISFSSSKAVTVMSILACLIGFYFMFQSELNIYLLIIEFLLFIIGILIHIYLDYTQSRKDLKKLFILEFEKLNERKSK